MDKGTTFNCELCNQLTDLEITGGQIIDTHKRLNWQNEYLYLCNECSNNSEDHINKA